MPALERRLQFGAATVTNILTMVGVGPFLTIPLLLQAMHGPQAMLGWIIGAIVAAADGLVWAELGAAMPVSGGGYHYLREAYGKRGLGELLSFLFLWSTVISGPLMIASGGVGFAQYATYLYPAMSPWQAKEVAIGVCLLGTALIYRRIDGVGRWGIAFSVAVLATAAWIIAEGALHFNSMQLAFPPGAFHLTRDFWFGLGGATLYAMYDYAGYSTVCSVGGEVVRPERTIPRSILAAVAVVAVLYLAMNVSIVAVLPWRQAASSKFVVSDFIAFLRGPHAAAIMTALVLVTAFASVFGGMLGLSRIPYAAAVEGRFFRIFARVHPVKHFPSFSVLFTGVASAACCLLDLDALIKATMVANTVLGSMAMVIAPALLRRRGVPLPFRMWLYPMPAVIAFAGWTYIVATSGLRYIVTGAVLLAIGTVAYFWRARTRRR